VIRLFWFIPVVLSFVTGLSHAAERPNILIIMTDDLRIGMLSSEGHPYLKTPNLDRLASESMKFNNCYALSPVCGPSRASIFTGQFSTKHMRRDNFYYPDHFDSYLPQHFKDSGYRTALIGKYYEGDAFRDTARKAWDRWFVTTGPAEDKRTPEMSHFDWWNTFLYKDQMYSVDGKKSQILGHQTDILFSEASRFVLENTNKPYCIFLSPFSPHKPLIMTDRNAGRYEGKGLPSRKNLDTTKGYFTGKGKKTNLIKEYEQYCEMIADIDDGMGVLYKTLEESGQLDNTLIIFTSDNGLLFGEHGFAWKRHAWEESTKVPFYVRYPKLLKPGSESEALICLADIFYTCAELGGVELPEVSTPEGMSIMPILSGKTKRVRDDLLLYQYEMPEKENPKLPEKLNWATYLRADGWKYTVYSEPPEFGPDLELHQLFNISEDEYEMNNCADKPENQKLTADMKAHLIAKLKAVGADTSWVE